MQLNYRTGRLSQNFLALGGMLLIVGIWRMSVLDWVGYLLVAIALILLFMRTGLLIDPIGKRMMFYTGLFILRDGQWKDISELQKLRIVATQESQTMHVLSISHTDTYEVFNLIMDFPHRSQVVMSGSENVLLKRAHTMAFWLGVGIDH